MTIHTTKILHLISLILLFCSISFAQNGKDSFLKAQGYTQAEINRFTQNAKDLFPQKSLEEKDVDLSIAVDKKKITVGEKIELNISLKNNYTHTFDLPYDLSDSFCGYNVEIKSLDGQLIQPSKVPQKNAGIGSKTGSEVGAGKEYKGMLLLSYFYELPPGKYSIIVNRSVNGWGKTEWVSVKSNSIDLTVIE